MKSTAFGLAAFIYTLAQAAFAAVLVDFQVAQPLTLPQQAKQCTVKILERTFGASYGSPEVVQYSPPINCGSPGSWAGISLNFTVTSNGTQYDRLGIFTLENTEIWRTSTPEPTHGDGIIWTHLKDVSRYTPLFAKSGTFVLQLDNLLEQGLDGQYATTLYATFYASSSRIPAAKHADLIIPISTAAGDGDLASVPPTFSVNVTIPQNANSIFAEIIPSGNSQEEFWCFNVPNKYLSVLPSGLTYGDGPFREVRLLVDGKVAGAVFPYVVIFTGGIAPTAWRPIAAYGALDLPTYYIDLTPFVPVLVDGKPHTISLDVVSAEADHAVLQNWYLTANLQITLDESQKPTTGHMTYNVAPFALTSTTGSVAANGDLQITVQATRNIQIESVIRTGSGKEISVVWKQDLSYINKQSYRVNGTIQTLYQLSSGSVQSTHNGVPTLADTYSFPLTVDFTYLDFTYMNWTTTIDHSYNRVSHPAPFVLGTNIQEHQLATAFFQLAPEGKMGNYGNGTSSNQFSYTDTVGNTYTRQVSSVNDTITNDKEGGSLAPTQAPHHSSVISLQSTFAKPRVPGGGRPN